MVGVLVTFQFEDGFDRARVEQVAEGARARFEGLPGLRFKFFAVEAERLRATNFYVWESEEAARAFFTDELVERVTGLYGVRPEVSFAEIVTVVDNSRAS
jgi:hypothetical protein